MESATLLQIQDKIQMLVSLLSEITPISALDQHPLDANTDFAECIISALDFTLAKAKSKKQELLKEIVEIKTKIEAYSYQLNINNNTIEEIENIYLSKEYLQSELNRLIVIRNQLKAEITVLLKRIFVLIADLDPHCLETAYENTENNSNSLNTNDCNDQGVSSDILSNININSLIKLKNNMNGEAINYFEISHSTISQLQNILVDIENKVNEMESKRQDFYDEIALYSNKLDIKYNFSYQEKISDLKQAAEKIKNLHKEKETMLASLINEVRTTESILNFPPREISNSLSEQNIKLVQEYLTFLKAEQSRLFDEIYDRTLENLTSITALLGVSFPEYTRTESSLIEMRATVERYKNIFVKHSEISDLIQKRKELLLKMTEFEKIASDPKRLFKSSFQLISEEKFRNSAYPSLLKIEETLLKEIDRFESDYGLFYFDNKPYRSILKYEIDNSTINRTVFRSRCDSPYRKKK